MIDEPALLERVLGFSTLLLFLDYDGTLAEFAPTPDHIERNGEVVAILERLSRHHRIRTAIVSGRRLSAIEALLPVAGVTLAGSYGVELRLPDGHHRERLELGTVRPYLDRLKPRWERLLGGEQGFFLEDKGWSIAIHARFARSGDGERVLAAARSVAVAMGLPKEFRFLGGDRFLEVAPVAASKADAVERLIEEFRSGGEDARAGRPLYLGDDDKDMEAFEPVHRLGGYAALVGEARIEGAGADGPDCRFADPASVRSWLELLVERFEGRGGDRGPT